MNSRIKRNKFAIIMGVFFLLVIIKVFSQNTKNKIIVDLNNASYQQKSVAGFLHSTQLVKLDDDIAQLKPAFWRIGWSFSKNRRDEILSTFNDKKITPILVVSDLYDYQRSNLNWIKPYESSSRVDQIITDVYGKYKNQFIYDIWNEPNLKGFWKESRQNFFQTYKVIYDKIRSMPGGQNAIIMGPSTAGFDKDFIDEFLNYCVQNKMRIDILAWHENGDIGNASIMQDRIAYARNNWLTKYKSVGIQDIYIPEIIDSKNQFNPLAALAYLDKLERSNATGGCKSCWGENCGDNSMDGILTKQSKPRSIWWAYKWYAESLTNRLKSTTSDKNIFSIANLSGDKKSLNVLFGNNTNSSNINININNVNKLLSLSRFKNYKVKLYKVPNSEEQESNAPILVRTFYIKSNSNQVDIELATIDKSGIYLINISK